MRYTSTRRNPRTATLPRAVVESMSRGIRVVVAKIAPATMAALASLGEEMAASMRGVIALPVMRDTRAKTQEIIIDTTRTGSEPTQAFIDVVLNGLRRRGFDVGDTVDYPTPVRRPRVQELTGPTFRPAPRGALLPPSAVLARLRDERSDDERFYGTRIRLRGGPSASFDFDALIARARPTSGGGWRFEVTPLGDRGRGYQFPRDVVFVYDSDIVAIVDLQDRGPARQHVPVTVVPERERAAPAAPDGAAWWVGKDRSELEALKRKLNLLIATVSAQGKTERAAGYAQRVADIEDLLRGSEPAPDPASRVVFGHPTASSIWNDMIPIRVRPDTDLSWRLDLAQKREAELAERYGKALHASKNGTPKAKKVANDYLRSASEFETGDIVILHRLRDETIPELGRLMGVQEKMRGR